MRTTFVYNGHEITLDRRAAKTVLLVDGVEADAQKGLIKSDKSRVYHASIPTGEKTCDFIEVAFVNEGLDVMHQVKLSVNGKLMDVKETL